MIIFVENTIGIFKKLLKVVNKLSTVIQNQLHFYILVMNN